jgi:hypothetical protein
VSRPSGKITHRSSINLLAPIHTLPIDTMFFVQRLVSPTATFSNLTAP